MKINIADIRIDYSKKELDILECSKDPLGQFQTWLHEAIVSKCSEPTAMTVSSADRSGRPSSRIVLLKDIQYEGFVFFTNYQSRKGKQFSENQHAAITFFWKELERQVNVEGSIVKVDDDSSRAYYDSRPYNSRIGAWASQQSSVIESRKELEDRFKEFSTKFPSEVPKPEHWGGYAIIPNRIEFWQGRPSRLHDRISYTKDKENQWIKQRLAP